MIGFIDGHRAAYGVEPICRVLPIAPSTYHAHAAKRADPGKRSARARRDAALQADIRRVWDANFPGQWRPQGLAAAPARGHPGAALPSRPAHEAHGPGGRGARQDSEDHAQRQLGVMPA
jgi:hypothetical protein